jgi:predicted extracellular nuclease
MCGNKMSGNKKWRGCLTILMALVMSPAQAVIEDLFISEYVGGSGFNKAIELYNGSGQTIDLSEYFLDFYSNGAREPVLSCRLSGLLTANTTYVVANSRAASEIQIVTNFTGDGIWFNGDDMVVLKHGNKVIDSFGQAGIHYGDSWGSGVLSSKNTTMRRVHTAARADNNIHDPVDFSLQWQGFANDNFDGLGHYVTAGKAFYMAQADKQQSLLKRFPASRNVATNDSPRDEILTTP